MKKVLVLFMGLLALTSCAQAQDKKAIAIDGLETLLDYEFSDPHDFCMDSSRTFNDLYILGAFANDAGCMREGLMYCDTVGRDTSLQAKILRDHGWEVDSNRAALALAWVQEVQLCWSTPITSYHEDFGHKTNPNYDLPKAVLTNQGIKVAIWVRQPAGMLPQNIYYKLEVLFGDDGHIVSRKRTHQFSVPN
jgi:hypothetical protein